MDLSFFKIYSKWRPDIYMVEKVTLRSVPGPKTVRGFGENGREMPVGLL